METFVIIARALHGRTHKEIRIYECIYIHIYIDRIDNHSTRVYNYIITTYDLNMTFYITETN